MLIVRAGRKGGGRAQRRVIPRHFARSTKAYTFLFVVSSSFRSDVTSEEQKDEGWTLRDRRSQLSYPNALVSEYETQFRWSHNRAQSSEDASDLPVSLLPVILLVADVIRRYQMPGSVVTIVVSGCHFPRWPRRLSKRALSSDRKGKVEGPAAAKVRDVPWSTGSRMESRIPLRSRNASRFEPRRVASSSARFDLSRTLRYLEDSACCPAENGIALLPRTRISRGFRFSQENAERGRKRKKREEQSAMRSTVAHLRWIFRRGGPILPRAFIACIDEIE